MMVRLVEERAEATSVVLDLPTPDLRTMLNAVCAARE